MIEVPHRFVELKILTGPIETVEGIINEALDELQKVPNVRIDSVVINPMIHDEQNSLFYFVHICGRRILRTYPQKEDTHGHMGDSRGEENPS